MKKIFLFLIPAIIMLSYAFMQKLGMHEIFMKYYRKTNNITLRFLLRTLRRVTLSLQKFCDKLENCLNSAKDDTSVFLDRAFRRMKAATRQLAIRNIVRLLSLLTIAVTFVLVYISSNNMARIVFYNNEVDLLFILFSFLMILANILYFAWQTLLYFRYKPVPAVSGDRLPGCTVIVPAYNEGEGVRHALESVLKSDYPAEKLEIIAIDDGSRDDTWMWISRTAEEAGGRLRTLRLEKNGGKRNAIYQGLRLSDKEIFVTIDSDSIVAPDTLRNLLSPFADDPQLGGVAGNIRVLNLEDGMVPRMLDVNFAFSFDFIRSAQSVIRSVMCTPGALSAYRRSYIEPFLGEWLNQTFLGQPSNIGEDRAITNLLIREGHAVTFQNTAVAFTDMPSDYLPLCKMLIRWARSNIRENLSMAAFAFRRLTLRDRNHLGMQINLIMQSIWMFTPMFFLFTALYCLSQDAPAFLYSVFIVTVIWSTFPALVYAAKYEKNESLWAYVFGFFNFLALSWIGPYSLLTVHRSGWLTRELKPQPEKRELPAAPYPPFLTGEKTCPLNVKKP